MCHIWFGLIFLQISIFSIKEDRHRYCYVDMVIAENLEASVIVSDNVSYQNQDEVQSDSDLG